MTEIDMGPDPVKLAIAGDWHGAIGWSAAAMEYAKRKGATTLLHVGDYGYWPAYDEYTQSQTGGCRFVEKVKEAAKELDLPVYWLDGNHENHDALVPGQGDEWVCHLPRGHRWSWWGKQFMALGGAVSVDRNWRTEGRDWWPTEAISEDDIDHAMRTPHGLDVIFTHDCPQGVYIPGIGPDSRNPAGGDYWPADALADSQKSRLALRRVWSVHQPKLWVHGHFHVAYEAWLGQTKVIGLDRDGSKMIENMTFLEANDLK